MEEFSLRMLWDRSPLPVRIVAGLLAVEAVLVPLIATGRLVVDPPDLSVAAYVVFAVILAVASAVTIALAYFLLRRSAVAWTIIAATSLGNALTVGSRWAWPFALVAVMSLLALTTPTALRWAWADKPKPYAASNDLRRPD